MSDRLLPFEALDNFRDFGGYATASGRLVDRRLFRSANQARATDADLAQMADLGITTVVDLRRPSERRNQPSRRPANWAGQVIESLHDDGGEAPHMTFLRTADLTADSGRAYMIKTYQRLAFEPAHIDLFTRYFRALADGEGAVLVHCAAGKDRTGLLVALTHNLLGVSRSDLIADYLLTNVALDLEGRAEGMARKLTEMTGRPASQSAVVAFLGVAEDYLEQALAAIEGQYGFLEAYGRRALRIDTAMIDQIQGRLTA